MSGFLTSILLKAAEAAIEALVARLLLHLWTTYARDYARSRGAAGAYA
jgi:hypothetical protein